MSDWDEAEERADRMETLRAEISDAMTRAGVIAYPYELENDILVDGALTDIIKVYLDYRSEIDEELG